MLKKLKTKEGGVCVAERPKLTDTPVSRTCAADDACEISGGAESGAEGRVRCSALLGDGSLSGSVDEGALWAMGIIIFLLFAMVTWLPPVVRWWFGE